MEIKKDITEVLENLKCYCLDKHYNIQIIFANISTNEIIWAGELDYSVNREEYIFVDNHLYQIHKVVHIANLNTIIHFIEEI